LQVSVLRRLQCPQDMLKTQGIERQKGLPEGNFVNLQKASTVGRNVQKL
jgi:hypothetical protein